MITNPIRSAFFAVVAAFLAAVTAAPFAVLAQEAAASAQDANEAKADEYFRDALDYRKKMETELHALEQDPAADRKQIDQMRQNLALFDRLLKNAKAQLANGAMSLSLGPVVNRPAMQTVPWQTIISDDAARRSESAAAKAESIPADDAAGPAKEMAKKPVSISFGDPDFLAKLYDLSLALPEDALVTDFRFNNGNCDLTIQTQNRTNPAEYMVFPYWRIGRLTQRIIANGVYSFSIFLVRKDDPSQPQKDSVTPENKAATIAARNIFDPDRTPKKTVKSGGSAVAPGSNGAHPDNPADLERQLQEAMKNRAELESLLQTLQSTPGVTNEQTGLLRQRLERYDQQIERLREQRKTLRP